MEGYQSYYTIVEEGIQPHQSFMLYNVISVTLWCSSKVDDSVRHDKLLEVMLSRQTHLNYKANQQKPNKINLGEGRMGGSTKILCTP